jgi:hypothetical protein
MPFKPQFDIEDRELETQQRMPREAIKEANKDKFLGITSMIESTGGTDLAHRRLASGLHAGKKAVGQYGFMPDTIEEMVKRNEGNLDPELQSIMERQDIDSQQKAELIASDPRLEGLIANKMYSHLYDKYDGNEELMNYGWEYGHNRPASKINRKKVEEADRTRKFRKLKETIGNKNGRKLSEIP